LAGFPCLYALGLSLACTSVTPAMSYLSTGLTGCLVGPRISRSARKLARTPRVIKKKKKDTLALSFQNIIFILSLILFYDEVYTF
jgi:hypothetical protein